MITKLLMLWKASRAPNTKIGPEHRECLKLVSFLQSQVLEHGNRLIWLHIANEYAGKPRYVFGQLLKALGKIAGAPDYALVKDGRVLFLEMKASKGKQSDMQLFFADWCKWAGCPYEIAYSFQEAVIILKKYNYVID